MALEKIIENMTGQEVADLLYNNDAYNETQTNDLRVSLEQQINTIHGNLSIINQDLEILGLRVADTETHITTINSNLWVINNSISEINSEVNRINSDLNGIDALLNEVNNQVIANTLEISMLSDKIKNLSDDYASFKIDINNEIESLNITAGNLTTDLIILNNRVNNLNTTVSSFSSRISTLESEYTFIKSEVETLQNDYNSFKTTINQQISGINQTITSMQTSITGISNQINNTILPTLNNHSTELLNHSAKIEAVDIRVGKLENGEGPYIKIKTPEMQYLYSDLSVGQNYKLLLSRSDTVTDTAHFINTNLQEEVGGLYDPTIINHNSKNTDGTTVGKHILVKYKDENNIVQNDSIAYNSDLATITGNYDQRINTLDTNLNSLATEFFSLQEDIEPRIKSLEDNEVITDNRITNLEESLGGVDGPLTNTYNILHENYLFDDQPATGSSLVKISQSDFTTLQNGTYSANGFYRRYYWEFQSIRTGTNPETIKQYAELEPLQYGVIPPELLQISNLSADQAFWSGTGMRFTINSVNPTGLLEKGKVFLCTNNSGYVVYFVNNRGLVYTWRTIGNVEQPIVNIVLPDIGYYKLFGISNIRDVTNLRNYIIDNDNNINQLRYDSIPNRIYTIPSDTLEWDLANPVAYLDTYTQSGDFSITTNGYNPSKVYQKYTLILRNAVAKNIGLGNPYFYRPDNYVTPGIVGTYVVEFTRSPNLNSGLNVLLITNVQHYSNLV